MGNRNSLTNALGNTWTYEYDDASRLTSITTPLGYSSTNTYDADGNVISATDANSNTTYYEYNAINKLISVTNALDNETSYTYDANGNLTEVEDTLGHSTTYEYDELNRLVNKTNPLNKSVEYSYDDEGNLTQLEKADGSIIEYNYDSNNRLSQIEYPDQTDVHLSYDDNGNRTSMSDEEGTTHYSYDDLNRLTQVNRDGNTISYEYDDNSNITEIECPDGTEIFYCYTDLNQIESVSDAVYSSYFMYNDIGFISQEILSNGLEVHYGYDQNNRLTVLDHVYGENSFVSFSYFLDNMGNPLSITDQDGGTTEYSYDDVYQLIEADYPDHDTVSYTYDAVGNRTSANNIDYTYNDANQLIDVDGTLYSYDDNGCLTSAGNKDYSYDCQNRLAEIDDGTNLINFFYDGDGNRIRETVAGAVYKTTEFVYDINFDISRLIAEADDQGKEYNYIYGNRLLERSGTDGLIFYHQDGLGSTSVVSSVYGEIVLEYDYDAFGNLWDTSGSEYNPMQFTGEYFDETGGLLYLRARYYDPNIGRFISPDSYTGELTDPLSQNLYVYCGNNPVANTDPNGHITVCEFKEMVQNKAGEIWYSIEEYNKQCEMDEFEYCMNIAKMMLKVQGISETDPEYYGLLYDEILRQQDSLDITMGLVGGGGTKMGSTIFDLQLFAKKADIRQIEAVAKKFDMKPEVRREFGDYIEAIKNEEGRQGNVNYTFQELIEKAKEFLGVD
ncbi:hypothetical protein ASZ90_019494 [hydrocarbon metagenome]|uniref:Teneurin-like YD-shell domain-containing protein n=1 Tax=hydrocarbon metagenome TaxID=938273 RepID=A0A0W8E3G4_9ZZZZ